MEAPKKYKERQQYAADFKDWAAPPKRLFACWILVKMFKKFQKHLELIGPYCTIGK